MYDGPRPPVSSFEAAFPECPTNQSQQLVSGEEECNAPSSLQIESDGFDLQGTIKTPNRLAGSSIPLQRLFLRDVAHPLGLVVPHLNDGNLVALGNAKRNLLTSGLYLF